MSEKINLDNDLNSHLKEIVPFEDQWISEDESFIRLKLDNLKHVKNKFNSMIKLKTKKIKRLDKEQKIEIKKYDTFLSQEYFPFLKFEQFPIVFLPLYNRILIENHSNYLLKTINMKSKSNLKLERIYFLKLKTMD